MRLLGAYQAMKLSLLKLMAKQETLWRRSNVSLTGQQVILSAITKGKTAWKFGDLKTRAILSGD